MDSKRGVYIIVAVVIVLLFGTLWVYDSFISPQPNRIELGNEDKLLKEYVKETLLPEYVTKKLSVQQGLTSSGATNGPGYSYGAIWSSNGAEINAFLQYTSDFSALADIEVLLTINQTSTLDSYTASRLLSTYFSGSYSPDCNTVQDTGLVLCQDFVEGGIMETGVGVLASPEAESTLLFSCKRFKDSPFFGKGGCFGRGSS